MTSTRAPAARPSHALRPASPGGQPRRWRGSPPLTLLAVAMGVMMVGLDGTIVAVANPAIQSHLHASLAGIQWISNAYLLALAVSLIAAGKAGDRFGHKRVFLTGVTGFAASSAAIGLAGSITGSITLVIAFRALQGVFGAMLQPTALALLRRTFPPEKLNGAIGVWGAVIGASTAAGPIVGGLLVQHIGWGSLLLRQRPGRRRRPGHWACSCCGRPPPPRAARSTSPASPPCPARCSR